MGVGAEGRGGLRDLGPKAGPTVALGGGDEVAQAVGVGVLGVGLEWRFVF